MKNCKRTVSILAGLLITFSCVAQGGRDSLTMAMLVPQQAVKFSPLHLVNFYPTIEVSFEQKVASQVTLQLEAGYVLDYGRNWETDFMDKRGVKLKLEGRYYFFGRTDKRKLYYLAGEAYTNVINFDRAYSQQECFDLACEHVFIRHATGVVEYREKGFTVKAGLMKYVGRFFFDLSSGWSIRDIEYRNRNNFQAEQELTIFDVPNEAERIVPGPNVGARLGFRFR